MSISGLRTIVKLLQSIIPAIFGPDADSGTSTVILLAPLHRPPDDLAGLLTVTLAAVIAVLVLVAGYPRLRPGRINKGGQGEGRSMSKGIM